ncbi:MAG: gliding motility-associated ABC transporter permease subunit GldF [bacterium]
MWNITTKELKSFFSTPTGYIVIGLFLIGTALFLWVFPGEYNILNSGYANLNGLFVLAPWLYLFLCPAITMRLFAEERTSGTMELLLTKPTKKWNIVIGKALAGWLLVIIALLPTIIWYVSVYILAEPMGNIDSGAFWGSWFGLILLAMVYTSVGIVGSALSKNQIIAFIISALLCFILFYGFELLGSMFSGSTAYILKGFGVKAHYESMARGVIDSRDIMYFITISVVILWFCKKSINK